MSDSVVKLRIDSKEYDANIKRAGQALTDYFNKVKEGGGTLMHLDEGVMEAVKAMGSLGTQANNIKGGLRELTQATTDMTAAYRALTDEEKASPLGQAMQKSIAQMTERAGDMRDAMADVQASINNAASDTRLFDQLAGGATLLTSSLQTAQGAARLFGVEMGDSVKVLADLQAAMAVTSGLQQLQNLLQKQSALMQGVNALQKEFNLLAAANPYALLATAVAAVAGAYMLYQKNASAAEKAQKSLNAELDNTQNQLSQIDKDTDFSVGIAEAAGKSWKAIHELRLEAARTKLQLADMNYDKLADSGNASAEQMKQAADMQQKAWDNVMKVLNEGTIHDVQMRNGKGKRGGKGGGAGSGKGTKQDIQFADDSIMAQEKLVQELTQKWKTASGELRDGYLKDLTVAQNKLNEMTGKGAKAPEMTTGLSGFNEQTISAWTSMIKSQLAKEDIGSDMYNSLTQNLADMSTLTTAVQDAMKLGLQIPQDAVQEMFEAVFDQGNLPEDLYAGMIQKFIDDFKKRTGQDLEVGENGALTVGKGKGKEEKKDEKQNKSVAEGFGQLTGGIQQMVGSMQQLGIEIPAGLSNVLGGIQSVVTILTTISTIVSAIEAISAADTFIPFARGGIVRAAGGFSVPGNNYSGDRVPALLNSGELVLNKAQQGNLASQLEGSGLGNIRLEAVASGEQLFFVQNNRGLRTGRGEIVQSKRRR